MADLLFVAAAVAFFAVAALYVTALDRLVGQDGVGDTTPGPIGDEARPVGP